MESWLHGVLLLLERGEIVFLILCSFQPNAKESYLEKWKATSDCNRRVHWTNEMKRMK